MTDTWQGKKTTRESRQDKYEELTHALNRDIRQDEEGSINGRRIKKKIKELRRKIVWEWEWK